MSGQPTRKPKDIDNFRQDYMDSLNLRASIDDVNYQANKNYKATGSLPPQSSMRDNRSTSEILADVVNLKVTIIKELKPLLDSQSASLLVQRIEQSHLNADGSLLVFLAQNVKQIVLKLKPRYSKGVKGDINDVETLKTAIENMYADLKDSTGSLKSFFDRPQTAKGVNLSDLLQLMEEYDRIRLKLLSKFNPQVTTDVQALSMIGYILEFFNILRLFVGTEGQLPLTNELIHAYINEYLVRQGIFNLDQTSMSILARQAQELIDFKDNLPKPSQIRALLSQLDKSTANKDNNLTLKILQSLMEYCTHNLTLQQSLVIAERIRNFSQIRGREDIPPPYQLTDSGGIDSELPNQSQFITPSPQSFGTYLGADTSAGPSIIEEGSDDETDTTPPPVQSGVRLDEGLADELAHGLSRMFADISPSPRVHIPQPQPQPQYPQPPSSSSSVSSQSRTGMPSAGGDTSDTGSQYSTSSSLTPQDEEAPTDSEDQRRFVAHELASRYLYFIKQKDDDTKRVNVQIKGHIDAKVMMSKNQPLTITHLLKNGQVDRDKINECVNSAFGLDTPEGIQVHRELIQNDYSHVADSNKLYGLLFDKAFDSIGFLFTTSGSGLKKRRKGRPKGSGISTPHKFLVEKVDHTKGIKADKKYVPFGKYLIHRPKLNDNILSFRQPSGVSIVGQPAHRVSANLGNVMRTIVGGGTPKFNELNGLTEEEKNYLYKVSKKAEIADKLSIPTPSKDQQEKDVHDFEVMKGEIMAGNDSKDLIKKFKLLLLKLGKSGALPKNDVQEVMEELLTLGY